MRLSELEPRWIHPNVFVFLCPHCKGTLLACKNIPMSELKQWALFEKVFGDDWNERIVPMHPEFAWNITGTMMDNCTVTPSIDASASGHWHGFITNGDVKP